MTVKGHAVRVRTPQPGAHYPIRWVVTAWCGERLEGVQAAFGNKSSAPRCAACLEALRAAQAA